ncbi:restriction endonuclease subunit S [Aeromonas sp. HMWF015]|uniref:restriction endonuclease subunit S n=1 Tax=Aeromonas sp. HMWF015 TaxID=2056851 RepID=UPI000D3B9295|nr:restriction endonuclease subunit S [Aeromonas sp. HMWF015]PTT57930.1 restriction endonuclease subunit S [Aeromonas sp. HMWF015]
MVPNGWKSYPLSEVCRKQISYGIVQTGDDLPNGIPCLRVVDLTKAAMCVSDMIKTSEEIHHAYKKTILEEGEIVMALRGEVGLVKIIDSSLSGANITRGLARISAKKSVVYPEFLLWELRSPKFRSDLMRRVGGSALQEISLTELRQVRTLIPPLAEQNKIAEILSTWDSAIITTEQLLLNSQQQKKALMQQLLTGKKRLSDDKAWQKLPLEQVAQVRTGVAKGKTGLKDPVVVPYLRVANVQDGYVNLDELKEIEVERDKMDRFSLQKGDVLMNEGGDFDKLGRGDVWLGQIKPCLHQNHVFAVRPDPEVIDSFFLAALAASNYGKAYFLSCAKRSTNLASINSTQLKKFPVLVPSLKEQKKIAAVLSTADQEISALQQKLDALKQEKKALMQQLLTGKRRVKVEEAA